MKHNKTIVFVVASLLIVLLLIGLFVMSESTDAPSDSAMENDQVANIQNLERSNNSESSNAEPQDTKRNYITLKEYNENPSDYSDTKLVYFFHASWCPICRDIDEDINADSSKIPAGFTIIKTDFDSSTDLRQKYGVTTQYTFVQVDSNGNETAQWSATNLDKAIAGIET
jgi:thiol-disulfide isomerase/thioredoxin